MKNKIIQNNLISCVAAVVLTAVVCIMTYSSYMASAMSMQAENQAYVIKEILQNHTENPVAALKDIEDSFKNRVTLVDNNGKVVYVDKQVNLKELKELGFSFPDSMSNFIFATHESIPAAELFEACKKENIFVRYFKTPRIDNYLRITIGTDAQMDRVVEVLKEYLEKR